MFPAPQILAVLVITTPIILVSDALITYGIVLVIASVSVAIIALRVRPGEATFLWSVIDAVAFVAAIPAICMLIQILPLPDTPLANPVWQSAASALGRPHGAPSCPGDEKRVSGNSERHRAWTLIRTSQLTPVPRCSP